MLPPVFPFPLNAIVYVFAVHCAYSVTVPPFVDVRFFTLALFAYVVPDPSGFVFHDLNVYPVFVYPFAVKFLAVSYVIDTDAVLPPVFPFPLNATVYVFAVQCAYSVIAFVGVYDAPPFPTLFPPVAASYHPANVYPVLVGVCNVIALFL